MCEEGSKKNKVKSITILMEQNKTGEVRQESPLTMMITDDIVRAGSRWRKIQRGGGMPWREEEWRLVKVRQNAGGTG